MTLACNSSNAEANTPKSIPVMACFLIYIPRSDNACHGAARFEGPLNMATCVHRAVLRSPAESLLLSLVCLVGCTTQGPGRLFALAFCVHGLSTLLTPGRVAIFWDPRLSSLCALSPVRALGWAVRATSNPKCRCACGAGVAGEVGLPASTSTTKAQLLVVKLNASLT